VTVTSPKDRGVPRGIEDEEAQLLGLGGADELPSTSDIDYNKDDHKDDNGFNVVETKLFGYFLVVSGTLHSQTRKPTKTLAPLSSHNEEVGALSSWKQQQQYSNTQPQTQEG